MARILVVDDEVGIRELLSEILYDEGHTIELAENAAPGAIGHLDA
jgi:CheY-like chemotaxis protein